MVPEDPSIRASPNLVNGGTHCSLKLYAIKDRNLIQRRNENINFFKKIILANNGFVSIKKLLFICLFYFYLNQLLIFGFNIVCVKIIA